MNMFVVMVMFVIITCLWSFKVLSFGCWADQADLSQLTYDEKVTRLKQALLTAGIEVISYRVVFLTGPP